MTPSRRPALRAQVIAHLQHSLIEFVFRLGVTSAKADGDTVSGRAAAVDVEPSKVPPAQCLIQSGGVGYTASVGDDARHRGPATACPRPLGHPPMSYLSS